MTYPANEQRPAAQFCPQCGSHVPRIAEMERQLAGANATIALFMGPDGEQQIKRFADALKNDARYRWIRSADPVTCDPELIPTLDGTALDVGIDAALALMVNGS